MLWPLKFFGVPGSIAFLVVGLVVAFALRRLLPRRRRVWRAWLIALVGGYLMLSLPPIATAIADGLPEWPPPRDLAANERPTLIVLDGDNRRGRVRTTMEHQAIAGTPIYILGGEWIPDELANMGVARERLTRVDGLPTTRAQLAWLETFAAEHRHARLALVASRVQMPRVAALAQTAALELDLLASPVDQEPPTEGVWRLVPTYLALRVSRDAIYEHAALAYYRWRGWIG